MQPPNTQGTTLQEAPVESGNGSRGFLFATGALNRHLDSLGATAEDGDAR